ncbi:MAG: SRPBCC family protein [Candidatus Eremiobacteraeota bacterium]|nr:SRPBCC family protein [Candidatus Eremiobacteraeota bacterium]
MAKHSASVTVNAPVHQVYELFSHFNDYPKFMRHVKEVTYYDDERSHWVAEVVGRHEWDAVNVDWVEDQQIGWRSTDGLKNSGTVRFRPVGEEVTELEVMISYDPPAGALGDIGETLGAGKSFEKALQEDLDRFARMVAEAPRGALDPESSSYLFNKDSAAARGKTTKAQDATMTTSSPRTAGSAQTTPSPRASETGSVTPGPSAYDTPTDATSIGGGGGASTTGIGGATGPAGVGGSATTGVSGTGVPGLGGTTSAQGAGATSSGRRRSPGTTGTTNGDDSQDGDVVEQRAREDWPNTTAPAKGETP